MVDMVVRRHELRDTLIRVFGLLGNRVPAAGAAPGPAGGKSLPAETDGADGAAVSGPGQPGETRPAQ